MLSWIFRNRARVQIVYGMLEPPALAGARFERGRDGPGRQGSAETPGTARPGELRRRGRQLELRPMPRRVG